MCRWSVTNTIIANHVELGCCFKTVRFFDIPFIIQHWKKVSSSTRPELKKSQRDTKPPSYSSLVEIFPYLWIKLHVEKTNVDRSGAYFWWIIHFKTVDTQSNYLDVGAQKSNIPAFFYYVLFLPCINLIGLLRRRLSFYTARHSIFIDAGKLWITMYHYQIYPVESITLDVSKGLEG